MRVQTCALALCLVGAARFKRKAKDCFSVYDGKPLLEFDVSNIQIDDLRAALTSAKCQDVSDSKKQMFAICDAAHASKVMNSFGGAVVSEDAGAFYRDGSGDSSSYIEPRSGVLSDDFYATWRNYDSRMSRMNSIVSGSGGVAKMEVIGKSFEGRDIKAIRLTGPGYTSGSSKVVLSFNMHAREWLSGMTGIYTLEKFVARFKSDPSFLDDTEVVIIPMVNPDGIIWSEGSERFWRKNRRVNSSWQCPGVDLNRNWGPKWGGSQGTSTDTCSDIWFGDAAFSEPETQALKKIIDESALNLHVDVHAYSEVMILPWASTTNPHPRREEINILAAGMQGAIYQVHGKFYKYGAAELLYPADGVSTDYASSIGAVGITYEVRPTGGGKWGFAPDVSEILPNCEEVLQGLYTGVDWAQGKSMPAPAPQPACRRRYFC